ncbi:hypothetical protein BO70DRAFT_303002 [Aspergillus heteromorphus CBS 117.55]|uniref:RNase MRP protein 1 RNA binding domain-containing protein n=1 Tax=Aspergillus heteromorphus CBS 117.55 TaxID=1448321 RepID=A0A317UQL8_9EURO|nr:uncharacterized protein BO70DRAFT_303002 [Aspergillus heteromorphus CBS 117.55]PWY64293.1 hypothetical protein BO70DRAFT_303002 [Aspergillus heteromorphus CBS 117.55]
MGMNADKITAIHAALHLIFHRNKNQHRGTKWWKWLSILKRTTLKLVTYLTRLPPDTDAKLLNDKHSQHLASYILPRCYLAFSMVVADGQFSTLGIVLLATLARLAKAVGFDKELRIPLQESMASIDTAFGAEIRENEDVGEVLPRPQDPLAAMTPSTEKHSIDLGHPIRQERASKKSGGVAGLYMAKHKKKKRRKDAIDDLFDSLL